MRSRALRLQKRDLELVRTVFLHRVARRDDLLKLGFFGSIARCNQRLSELVQANWLRKVEGINGFMGHQSVYAPARAASAYLRQCLDLPESEIAKHCSKSEGPLLVEHAFRVMDFRVRLRQQCSTQDFQLREWLCEPECLHEFEFSAGHSGPWETMVIKPDAYFRLQKGQERRDLFLEMDLGNVSLPRFQEKLVRFGTYAECGAFSEAYRASKFALLTVTVGERRLSHLAELSHRGFEHLVTTWARIDLDGVFGCTCNTGSTTCVSLGAAPSVAA